MAHGGDERKSGTPRKGRGSASRPDPRYLDTQRAAVDDEWPGHDDVPATLRTTVTWERPRTIISRNRSPDLPFEQTLNPYRGCEHGCTYCYARPTHAYLDLSPGLDFETRLFAKADAARVLERELAAPGYRCTPFMLGANTDAYQPIERELRVTRAMLEVIAATRHPVSIVTKSALVERDIDLLRELAQVEAVQVFLSITTLDATLARRLEPRAASPQRRLAALRALAGAGVRCGVMIAPVIPALNDPEIEAILAAVADTGARHAGYVMLRLPREVGPLFQEWLSTHYPLKESRVLSLLRDLREGALSDARFGTRMTGTGVFAQLIRDRFRKTCARLGLNRS
ncbi:MAG: PA0069 family radical SAM protein, partial [Gammaproteobacteria bacterium]